MARVRFMDVIKYTAGFILARPKIEDRRRGGADYATEGSFNVLFVGQGKPVPFKGLALVSDVVGGTTAAQVSDGVGAITDIAP